MNAIGLKAIPTFRITNYRKALDFYCDFLGCSMDWEHRFGPEDPVYMQVSKYGLVLHLSENNRFQTGGVVFVTTTAIDEYAKELNGRRSNMPVTVSDTPWQTRQMEIEDPFGNLLRFNEPLPAK
jgi:catechol 2,3-dioxygenase-like lactoylglutathione lyase family enzyme